MTTTAVTTMAVTTTAVNDFGLVQAGTTAARRVVCAFVLKTRGTRGTSATKGANARAFTIHLVRISTLQDVSGPNYDSMVHYAGAKTSATSLETANKQQQITSARSAGECELETRLRILTHPRERSTKRLKDAQAQKHCTPANYKP